MHHELLMIIVGYLLGSIPFGLIVSRIWKLDIRNYGSKNIGATNVYRTLGALAGGAVFILDYLKGYLAVSIGFWTGGSPFSILLLGVFAVLGHMFSVFLRFKGGKGVATATGVLAGIEPVVFLFTIIFALLLLFLTRYVSVASIASAFFAALLMYLFHRPLYYTLTVAALALTIAFSHYANFKRLASGTEPRLGGNK